MKIYDLLQLARKGLERNFQDLDDLRDWCKETKAYALLPYLEQASLDFQRFEWELNGVSRTIYGCDWEAEDFFDALEQVWNFDDDGKSDSPETDNG